MGRPVLMFVLVERERKRKGGRRGREWWWRIREERGGVDVLEEGFEWVV